MSGGQLVVLDRLGRDVKRFPLAHGLVTLGSDHSCDIRFMLDTVSPHHATVAVHANQTVVRSVCSGETLVNGREVSVAALRHGDVISIGGRQLRWEYEDPAARRPQAPLPVLAVRRREARGRGRRGSGPAPPRRDPALQLALEMSHRASMPANAGGKQVAIVQPQRRDTTDQTDKPVAGTPLPAGKRQRTAKSESEGSAGDVEADNSKRKSGARAGARPPAPALHSSTKASLWIESRKSSPRRAASARRSAPPLRLAALRRAHSQHAAPVTKIQEPSTIDHTKQAAILLMTGHTPKSKLLGQKTPSPRLTTSNPVSPKSVTPKFKNSKSVAPNSPGSKSVSPKRGGRRSGSFVVKKKSPVPRSTPRGRQTRASAVTASPQDRTVTILEITDSTLRSSSRRSGQRGSENSSLLPSPRKSALKDPLAKKSMRKTESIKFDLSNLDNYSQESDVLMLSSTGQSDATDEDMTLHYETSSVQSPSPRRSIHSRTSKILEQSLGNSVTLSPSQSRTLTPESPRPKKSLRGSIILQKALNKTDDTLSYSRRTTKSASSGSRDTTVASAFRTRTLSPRSPQSSLETYSIVDLVSINSNESGRSASVYDSAGSVSNTTFGTPQTSAARKTRSTINAALVDSSTPYVKGTRSSVPRSRSSSNSASKSSSTNSQLTNRSSASSRKAKSTSTPESSVKHVSVNSTRVSRASRSRSRITDSDLMLVDRDEADDSPRSSKRLSTASKRSGSSAQRSTISKISTPTANVTEDEGTSTPENRHSPEEASTPVLSIQSLLDSSQSSILYQSSKKRGRPSLKRKTIGALTGPKMRISAKSKSMNFSARKTRLRMSNDSYENMNVTGQQDEEIVTPKSAVKLVQEAVKNKHSTAKKPQSKRSIIDDLNDSDIVKQLFNSPVKRKLSQSMTEFSKKLDNDDVEQVRRPTRNTVAVTGRSPDRSLLDRSLLNHTEAFTPERFVSPIGTPSNSPNLTGIKLMFGKSTPENDLRNVKVKALLRTPRARKSIKNDLTDVAGVKLVFAKSPRNDLRRISGVKSLFQSQKEKKSPRNSLSDVRGVKKLFSKRSPTNDLRNVSGTKRTLRRNSPRNDLSDVRGVKRTFRRDKRNELSDLSGVEELFNESTRSHRDAESLFDRPVGRPTVKAVYSKTFSSKSAQKTNKRNTKSLHASLDVISDNVEEWLEQELHKRLHRDGANKSRANVTRELHKLATATVQGAAPLRPSRARTSAPGSADGLKPQKSASELYSAHTLPIKKRSLVDASLERAKNDSKPIHLPIKKRAVVHSTPVKGKQVNMTMNASELGRVSPIVADKTRELESDVLSVKRTSKPVEARPKTRRGTKATVNSPEFRKPSPQKTRGKSKAPIPTKTTSPMPSKLSPSNRPPLRPVKSTVSDATKPPSPKTTRARRTVVASPPAEIKTKKRGATLVVAKKSLVNSPQPRASRRRKGAETSPTTTTSPKKTRTSQSNEKVKTPKNTRGKKQKATVVVVKPSPQLKPRATRGRAQQTDIDTSKAKKAGGKKVDNNKVESPNKSPASGKTAKKGTGEQIPKTRRRNTAALKDISKQGSADIAKVQPKTKQDSVEHVPKTRGRKTAGTKDVSKQSSTDDVKAQPKTRRGRNTTAEQPVATRNTIKVGKQEPAAVVTQTKAKKGQKQEKVVEEKKTRGKQVTAQESVQSEPTTRSRKGKLDNSAPPVQNTRKRKSTASNERPTKLRRTEVAPDTRAASKKIRSPNVTTPKKAVTKESKKKTKSADTPKKSTRSKKVENSTAVPKEQEKRSGRGRKTVVADTALEVGKRKRKTAADLPAQEAVKRSRASKPARSPRAVLPAPESKVGRSRRR